MKSIFHYVGRYPTGAVVMGVPCLIFITWLSGISAGLRYFTMLSVASCAICLPLER